MLYFLHGDSNKALKKSSQMIGAMLKKRPDSVAFKLNAENFTENKLQEFVESQMLFSQRYIVQLSRVTEDKAAAEILEKYLEEIQNSENIFIWFEEKVGKPLLKKVEKLATQVQSFESAAKKEFAGPNIFDLANAVGERDKKRAWILYAEATASFAPEEIYGTLWWQFKSMLLAQKTQSADEAGMKSFPYNKAKSFSKKFSEEELAEKSADLISIYHESRLQGLDLSESLEKFILNL